MYRMTVMESIKEWGVPVAGGVAGIAVGLLACKFVRDRYLRSKASKPDSDQRRAERQPLTGTKDTV